MLKIGIALIVFGGRERKDLDGVLKDCASAGYVCVETGLLFDLYSPEQLKETCKKYNLEYAAVHGGFDNFRDEANVDKLIQDTLNAGGSYLMCSGVGKGEGLDGFREAASVFNRVGEKCKESGLIFCYHNHAFEFEEIEGIKGIHLLGEETDPELVKFEIDVAWVHIGGESPAEFIERYKDRCEYYHFKDALVKGKDNIIWTELGKGEVNLKTAYEAALKYNATYIIYEQDVAQIEVMQAITESREYLRSFKGNGCNNLRCFNHIRLKEIRLRPTLLARME